VRIKWIEISEANARVIQSAFEDSQIPLAMFRGRLMGAYALSKVRAEQDLTFRYVIKPGKRIHFTDHGNPFFDEPSGKPVPVERTETVYLVADQDGIWVEVAGFPVAEPVNILGVTVRGNPTITIALRGENSE